MQNVSSIVQYKKILSFNDDIGKNWKKTKYLYQWRAVHRFCRCFASLKFQNVKSICIPCFKKLNVKFEK